MKYKLLITLLSLIASYSFATEPEKSLTTTDTTAQVSADKSQNLSLELLTTHLTPNKVNTVTFRMHNIGGSIITPDDLQQIHTQVVHVLLLDPSYTEYQHLHPEYIGDGKFEFSFIPKHANLHIWADIRLNNDSHFYLMNQFGNVNKPSISTLKPNYVYNEDGYTFKLTLDNQPKANEMTNGKITVTKNGEPVTDIQEIMGVHAHVLIFADDYKTIVHTHQLENNGDHKQGILDFHLEPEKSGFAKMYAQIKINDKEYFVPFNLNIK